MGYLKSLALLALASAGVVGSAKPSANAPGILGLRGLVNGPMPLYTEPESYWTTPAPPPANPPQDRPRTPTPAQPGTPAPAQPGTPVPARPGTYDLPSDLDLPPTPLTPPKTTPSTSSKPFEFELYNFLLGGFSGFVIGASSALAGGYFIHRSQRNRVGGPPLAPLQPLHPNDIETGLVIDTSSVVESNSAPIHIIPRAIGISSPAIPEARGIPYPSNQQPQVSAGLASAPPGLPPSPPLSPPPTPSPPLSPPPLPPTISSVLPLQGVDVSTGLGLITTSAPAPATEQQSSQQVQQQTLSAQLVYALPETLTQPLTISLVSPQQRFPGLVIASSAEEQQPPPRTQQRTQQREAVQPVVSADLVFRQP